MMTRIRVNLKVSARDGSAFGGENQNYNAKLKINKIQTPVIASPPKHRGGAKQSQK